jgi:hypothetical protein
MIRERAATNFFMGYFSAEALLMTETGNSLGSYQIAGNRCCNPDSFLYNYL